MSVYLDNAATSFPKPRSVVEAIRDCLGQSLTVARSTHSGQFRADDVLRRCRMKLASFLGATQPEEIIFTFSATDSLSMAIHGLVPDGSHVLVSPLEHHSVMRPLYHLQREGRVEFSVLDADAMGRVDPDSVRRLVKPETSCIIINWVSNVSGTEQPVRQIGEVAAELGVNYLLDASQAAGTHRINAEELKCTAMAMPGHKSLMSIPGTGVLYIHRDCEMPAWRIGGTGYRSELLHQPEERPHRYESGTPNVAGIVGLDASLDWFEQTGLEAVGMRCRILAGSLYDGLSGIPGIRLIGPDFTGDRGYVISFCPADVDPMAFSEVLSGQFGITTRPGLHCAPPAHDHFGTSDLGGTVRLSVGYFTTDAEIQYCIESVRVALSGFGSQGCTA